MKKRKYTSARAVLLAGIMMIIAGILPVRTASAAFSQNTRFASGQTAPAVTASASGAVAAPSTAGALRVQGTRLVGENGRPVQLRGISTHGIAWFPAYINEAAFRQFRTEWNANVVRLAMYTAEYGGYCSGGDREQLKALIRSGVRYAEAQDLYVIIDWHILSDGNPNTHKEEAKSFFAEMSGEFAANKNVLYEICNEPNGGATWQEIKAYAGEIIPVIRANDPDAVIIVGTPNWSQYVDQAAADPITGYDNIMYALHFYAATHKEDLRARMTGAIQSGLPVFVTEYGICDASGSGAIDEAQADEWVRVMNQYGVSYVAWNLSNKNETSAVIQSGCAKTSGFTESDLSASGRWLRNMLTGGSGGNAGASAGVSGSGGAAASAQSGPGYAAGPGSTGTSGSSAAGPGSAGTTGSAAGPGSTGITGSAAGPGSTVRSGQVLESGGMQVTAAAVNSWTSGGENYTHYTLELKNISGSAMSRWTVTVPFTGAFRLTDSWNGSYAASGQNLTISSLSYNGAVSAGGTVSDVGFIVAGGTIAGASQ